MMDPVTVLSWLAIVLLSVSYWFQIYKIYCRKEVTDLSLSYHVCLATGFAILAYTAYVEDSVIFMTKQIMTTIPVMILISQILYFEHFYEQGNEIITDHSCLNCKTHIEIDWNYCSLCGFATETAFRQQSATLASTASSPPPSCAAS